MELMFLLLGYILNVKNNTLYKRQTIETSPIMRAHIYLYRNENMLVGAYSSIFVAIIISLTFMKSKKLKNLLILSMFIVLLFSSCGLQQNLSASSKLSEGCVNKPDKATNDIQMDNKPVVNK